MASYSLPDTVSKSKTVKSWDFLSSEEKASITLYYQLFWKLCALDYLKKHVDTLRDILERTALKTNNSIEDSRFILELHWVNSSEYSESDIKKISGSGEDEYLEDVPVVTMKTLILDKPSLHKFEVFSPDKFGSIASPKEVLEIYESTNCNDLLVSSFHCLNGLDAERSLTCLGLNAEGYLTEFLIESGGSPNIGCGFTVDNFLENIIAKSKRKLKKKKKKESQLESELYDWLILNSIPVHRQAKKTSGNIVDLWIPDTMFLELKRGSVTGNDVCQAIEYYSESGIPVVLVGDKITTLASKGLKGLNAISNNSVVFIDWICVKDYLKGKLDIS